MLATPELIREAAQIPQLEELLPRWRDVPLYRHSLARAGCRTPDFECFKGLPLLAKRDMRNGFPRNFLSEGQVLESLLEKNLVELEHTSGTSEERLPVIFGRGWWNAQEECALRLNDFVARVLDEHPNARRATLVPPACNGLTCPTVWMSREQRTLGNTLYLNLARIPFLLDDADLARMAAEIAEWSPQFLDLDPVHGARFALYCEQHGIRFPSVRFVLCSYEFVSVVHRRILERALGVPVFNLYGSTETGHLLMENERGEMKPSYDTAFLEIVDADEHGIGELVVTTLTNDYMPLLRYRIGDLAERIERPYASDFVVHGRSRDALTSRRRAPRYHLAGGPMFCRTARHRRITNCDRMSRVIALCASCRMAAGRAKRNWSCVSARLGVLLDLHPPIKTEAMPVLVPAASGKFRLTQRTAGI